MLLKIESPDNNRIKTVRKLANRKARDEENKIVIEGINLVSEAVRRNIRTDFIMVSDDFNGGDFLTECINDPAIQVCEVKSAAFNRITDAENGVGILAVIDKNELGYADMSRISGSDNVLVLDRVQDPGNLGTMIRTAVAAGYSMIIAVRGTADVYSQKVLRATAGMIFDIPVKYVDDAQKLRDTLKVLAKRIVVTTVDGGRPYFEENLKNGIALVIGNEGNGVSQEVLNIADVRVTIPMRGEIESLNVAVSAAILMYEAIRD